MALRAHGHDPIVLNISTDIMRKYSPYAGLAEQNVFPYFEQQGLSREAVLDPDQRFILVDSGLVGNVIKWTRAGIVHYAGLQNNEDEYSRLLERFPGLLIFGVPGSLFPPVFGPDRSNKEMGHLMAEADRIRQMANVIEERRHHSRKQASALLRWKDKIHALHIRERTDGNRYVRLNVSSVEKLFSWRWKVEVIKAFLETAPM